MKKVDYVFLYRRRLLGKIFLNNEKIYKNDFQKFVTSKDYRISAPFLDFSANTSLPQIRIEFKARSNGSFEVLYPDYKLTHQKMYKRDTMITRNT